MKFGIIFAAVFLISLASHAHSKNSKEKSEEISIQCTLSRVGYVYFGAQPSCTLKSKVNIKKAGTKIISVEGGCSPSKPNTSVRVFYALGKVIRYLPSGLEFLFPELIGIHLESVQLSMISSTDLQAFPNLLMFASVNNKIQFLEPDLFKFNLKLQYVSFRLNPIAFIDPNVFQSISGSLIHLYMDGLSLPCGLGNALSPNAVKTALAKLAFSPCTDITNAPPLYILYIELKKQLEECGDTTEEPGSTPASTPADTGDLSTCQADLQVCNDCRIDPTKAECQ